MAILKDEVYPLTQMNEANSGLKERDGGFSNYVVCPLTRAQISP